MAANKDKRYGHRNRVPRRAAKAGSMRLTDQLQYLDAPVLQASARPPGGSAQNGHRRIRQVFKQTFNVRLLTSVWYEALLQHEPQTPSRVCASGNLEPYCGANLKRECKRAAAPAEASTAEEFLPKPGQARQC